MSRPGPNSLFPDGRRHVFRERHRLYRSLYSVSRRYAFESDSARRRRSHNARRRRSRTVVDGEAPARDVSVEDDGGPEDASPIANDGSLEGGPLLPPPVCARFDPSITQDIAEDMVSTLLVDCRIRRHFLAIPAVRLAHFQECFAAQLASVMGCVYPDGKRYKYPAFDSQGQFCRDMQTGHAAMSTSDGDFDAFVDDLEGVLRTHQLAESEVSRTMKVFGSVRSDVVKKKDAGPTALCEERDAAADAPLEALPP